MMDALMVREWDSDEFHRRVLELERQGYVCRGDSYTITPEVDPETGGVIHLYSVEMDKSDSATLGHDAPI